MLYLTFILDSRKLVKINTNITSHNLTLLPDEKWELGLTIKDYFFVFDNKVLKDVLVKTLR